LGSSAAAGDANRMSNTTWAIGRPIMAILPLGDASPLARRAH
jgi:hypothetical protein